MYKILEKREVTFNSSLLKIEAPLIAERAKAGNFVILQIHEKGERFPLTICDKDPKQGSITIIAQIIGKSTAHLCSLNVGDELYAVVGPLGKPTHVENYGTCCILGGGVGIALNYPITKALKEAGNHIVTIIGGRDRSLLMLEDELRELSDEMIVTTDDGSYGEKGLVTDPLKKMLEGDRKIDFALCIGPIPMMAAVANTTKPYGVKTMVSLNPVMVDGTGMCGCCRVTVGGKTLFACIDGPEFDGHEVDFKEMAMRNRTYLPQEKESLELFKKQA